ncbi:hypothetical protein D0864_06821 [Hortaea werneckii]|uniref:Uncharacterized protein n=1 Tax=Hortaea werneckii TaxID=91943 RepID=A0A3M7FFW0_HORWE|nr:hypothetical protein D0864_06821 [Hortaea werneckii]
MSSKDTRSEPPSYEGPPEDEEHLPLYGGFEHEQVDQNALPASTASPDEVRQFIMHILVSRRQLPTDHARRVAARWTVGSGLELRTYSPSMYLELFGSEDGWILYKEVKLMMHAESKKKPINRYGPDIFLAVLSVFFIISVVLVVLQKDTVSFIIGLFGILGGGLVLAITLLTRCLGPSPEQTVVNELRHASERASSRNN